jgi:transcription elongation factor Elf1
MRKDKITVSRKWFERIMELWDWKTFGCPLCGATSESLWTDKKDGFTARYGCIECNQWFNDPEVL